MIEEFDFLLVDEPLKKHTSFKIGGPADLFAQPSDKQQLMELVTSAHGHHIPVSVFGSGTNLLVSDKGIRGLVIFTRKMKSGVHVLDSDSRKTIIQADAGERLAGLCRFANDKGLSGIEFAAGIPGTLGGALMMNAGTPDGRMADLVVCLELFDPIQLACTTVEQRNLHFSYRHLDVNGLILSACLSFEKSDPKTVTERYNKYLERKKRTQPVSSASAGCFFKNPEDEDPAGKLIEDAGLKGRKVNDAMISDVHANYIVNLGNATCKDVLLLQEMVQTEIFKKYSVRLETEVRVEGET